MRSGEIIGNEVDNGGLTLYWGFGDDGAGNSLSQVPIAGQGFADARVQAASVASIAALRALPYAVLAAVTPTFTIEVKSYYAGGSGAGGGRFVWNATSTAADDAGFVINPTGNSGSGRFLRIFAGDHVTLEMFGGQVTTNSAAPIDCAAAFQAAVNTGFTVKLSGRMSASDSSYYYVKSSVICSTPGQIIAGRGRFTTFVFFDSAFSTTNGSGVFVFNSATLGAGGPILRDFRIAGFQPNISNIQTTVSTAGGQTSAGATIPMSSTSGLSVGQYVYGNGIPLDATIASIVANTSITLSASTTYALPIGMPLLVSNTTTAAQLATLVQISGVDARNTIQFQIIDMAICACLRAVDMRGNCGQAVINNLHSCAFLADIDIDGSPDSVRIHQHHNFPQNVTANQGALMIQTCVAAINVGRMDDLKISDSMSIQARVGLNFYQGSARTVAADGYTSSGGIPTVSVSNHNFDGTPVAVNMSAGQVSIVGGYVASYQAASVSGGSLGFTGTQFTSTNRNGYVTVTGGSLSIVGSPKFLDVGTNYQSITVTGGTLTFVANRYIWATTAANVSVPKISVSGTGRLVSTDCLFDPFGIGTLLPGGYLYQITNAGYHVVDNITAPGWQSSYPTDSTGIYPNSGTGFFGTALPTSKPTVTGAKSSNAALASLIAALASYGLVADNTTT